MKNKLLPAVCGFTMAFLLLFIFSLLLMKDAGVFPAGTIHASFVQSFLSGLRIFHYHPAYAVYVLSASAFLFCSIALIAINCLCEENGNPQKKMHLINTVSLFIITMFITITFAFIGVDPHHDGIMLKPAMDVAYGKILFKETFTQYGALTVLLQAAALAVFGKTLIVLRLLTSLFYGFIAVLLYALFIEFLKKWQAVLAVLLWLLMAPFYLEDGGVSVLTPWSSVYSLFCQIICILLCVRFFKTRSACLPVICGVFAALTFLFRQPVGITILGSLFLCIASLTAIKYGTKAALHAVFGLISGFAAAIVCFLVYLLYTGSFADWYLQSIVFMGTWNEIETRKNIMHYLLCSLTVTGFPFTKAWLWRILPLACGSLSVIVSYFIFVKKQVTAESTTLFIILVGCLSSWAQYYPVPCNSHLFWAASPMFGIAVYAAWKVAGFCRPKAVASLLFATILLLIFSPEIVKRIDVGFNKVLGNFENNVAAKSPLLKGMVVSKTESSEFERLSDTINSFLNRYPDKTVINLGKDALFSALSGNRRNAHCVYINWGKQITGIYPDYYEKVAGFIEKELPVCLVPKCTYSGEEILDPVLKRNNYIPVLETCYDFLVMVPSSLQTSPAAAQ